jgi:hypothetical protein
MQIKYFLNVISVFLLSLTSTFSNSMIVGKVQGDTYISLNGVINRGDLDKWIIPTFKNLEKKYIVLNSTGGDVEEAMKIGRYFKANEFTVTVGETCFSSCVFLLAGGVDRYAYTGKVGIHRAYFGSIDKSLSSNQIRDLRDKLNSELKKYLEEMDINPSLVDAMNSYPPESMKVLSTDELKNFRLNVQDANYEEKQTAKLAYMNNMSSVEYRVKSSVANNSCRPADIACEVMSMHKITKNEFDLRYTRFETCLGNNYGESNMRACWRKHMARGEK